MTTNRKRKNATRTTIDAFDIGDDLRITKTTRRASGAGTWVIGTIAGHDSTPWSFPSTPIAPTTNWATAASRSSGCNAFPTKPRW